MESSSVTSPELRVERISAEQTHPLRMQVLRPGYPEAAIVFPGDEDPSTLHVGALLGDELVAIASLYLESRPTDAPGTDERADDHDAGTAWRLRGMATHPAQRRRGAGAATLRACERHATEHDGTLLWCNARTEAVPFYEANGWVVLGEEFDIPTVGPHFIMEKRIG